MAATPRALPLCSFALRPVFLLFGDSITQRGSCANGWASRLADSYGRRVDVLNRGYSGYNTAKALRVLPLVFPPGSSPPALVTVFLGANDAALQERHLTHHVPVAAYAAKLEAVVEHVRSVYGAAAPPVVLVTPPPVDEAARVRANTERHGTPADAPAERRLEVTAQYAAACAQLGARLGCPVLDAFTLFQQVPGWQSHLNDGLHFAEEGDRLLHTLLLELIERQLPQLAPAALSYDLPEWSDWAVDGEELSVAVQPGSPYCG